MKMIKLHIITKNQKVFFFIHQLMHKWIVLKTALKFTLKFTLKQLRHVLVLQLHHHQGAQYSCLLMLLTYSMVQSPSWQADWFAASQEIPCISRNPKVHYRTYKRPTPVFITGQPNPVHIPTSHLLKIHPNIIHPSTPRSSQWSPSLQFPHQDPIHPPLLIRQS